MRRTQQSLFWSCLAATTLVACQGAPFGLGGPGLPHRTVSSNVYNNVSVGIEGRTFQLRTADGQPLPDLKIQAAGKFYNTREGQLHLPALELKHAVKANRPFFVVYAEGYAPKQVWIGQADDEVLLSPATPVLVAPAVPASGGKLEAPDGSSSVTLPAGLLKRDETPVSLSTYEPTISDKDQETAAQERNDFLASLGGLGLYRVQSADCPDPEAPLPCPPIELALGMLLTIDGPIRLSEPSTIQLALDLDVLLARWNGQGSPPVGLSPAEIKRAKAAARLLKTFANIDADPRAAAIRHKLAAPPPFVADDPASGHGLALSGHTLTLTVPIDRNFTSDGYTVQVVQGVMLLGVKLEVTVVAASRGELPATSSLPPLIALQSGLGLSNGANLIGDHGGGIISDRGGSIISNNGGNIIGNNAGGFVAEARLAGTVEVPFAPGVDAGAGKWRLLSFTDYRWPDAAVLGINVAGSPYGPGVRTDATGTYAMTLRHVPEIMLVESRPGPYRLLTLARLAEGAESQANLDAATTAITCWIIDELRARSVGLGNINYAGFLRDVGEAARLLSQADAEAVVQNDEATNAELIRGLFAADGLTPSWRYASGSTIGTFATGAGPRAVAIGPNGQVWVVNYNAGTTTRLAPDGAVLGTFSANSAPTSIAVDAGGNAWVTNYDEGAGTTVTKLAPNGAMVGTYNVGLGPSGIAVDAGGNAWVEVSEVADLRKLSPTGASLGTYTVGSGPRGIAIDGDGGVWVTNFDSGFGTTVTKLDAAGNRVGTYAVGVGPRGVAIDPAGNAWVTNFGDNSGNGNTVTKLSSTGASLGTFTVGPGPAGIAIDGDGNAWVANYHGNSVSKLSPTGALLGTYAVGAVPWGVAIDGTGCVWVSNNGSGTITKLAP